jgi:hypothetical protein
VAIWGTSVHKSVFPHTPYLSALNVIVRVFKIAHYFITAFKQCSNLFKTERDNNNFVAPNEMRVFFFGLSWQVVVGTNPTNVLRLFDVFYIEHAVFQNATFLSCHLQRCGFVLR